jgi:hypothetical protein
MSHTHVRGPSRESRAARAVQDTPLPARGRPVPTAA